jgi:hypothetical protein
VAQNTFTIITRISPGDLDALDRLLSEIGQEVEKNDRIRFAEIASLHMAGIVIAAQDPRFAPILMMTIQLKPVRERLHGLPRFVTVRGGAYFFLPSIRALRFLAQIRP